MIESIKNINSRKNKWTRLHLLILLCPPKLYAKAGSEVAGRAKGVIMFKMKYMLLALALASAILPAHAMKRSMALAGKRIVKPFVNGVEPATEKFVYDTLDAAYPELCKQEIRLIEYDRKGFAVDKARDKTTDILWVPIVDRELDLAHKFKKEQKALNFWQANDKLATLDKDYHCYNIQQESILERNAALKQARLLHMYYLLENAGRACQPSTIDFWKAAILHEGAHIKYQDSKHNCSYKKKYAALQNLKQPSLFTVLNKTLCMLPHFMRAYYSEWRADYEITQRADNIAVVKAIHANFKSIAAYKKKGESATLHSKMLEILECHPSYNRRAQYFKKAIERLETSKKD